MATVKCWLAALGIEAPPAFYDALQELEVSSVSELEKLQDGQCLRDRGLADNVVRSILLAYSRAKLAAAVERQMIAMEVFSASKARKVRGPNRVSEDDLIRFACATHCVSGSPSAQGHRRLGSMKRSSSSRSGNTINNTRSSSVGSSNIRRSRSSPDRHATTTTSSPLNRPSPQTISDITYQMFQCTRRTVAGPQLHFLLWELKRGRRLHNQLSSVNKGEGSGGSSRRGSYGDARPLCHAANGMERIPMNLQHEHEFEGGARRRRSVSRENGAAIYGWAETEKLLKQALEFANSDPRTPESPRRLRKAIRTAQNRGFTSPSLSEATELLDNLESSCNTTLSSCAEEEKSDDGATKTLDIPEASPGDMGTGDTNRPVPELTPLEESLGSTPAPQPTIKRQGSRPQVEDVPLHLALPAPISADRRRRMKSISREVNEYILALLAEKDKERSGHQSGEEAQNHTPRSRNPSTPNNNNMELSKGHGDSKQPVSSKAECPARSDSNRKSDDDDDDDDDGDDDEDDEDDEDDDDDDDDSQRRGLTAMEILPSEGTAEKPANSRPKRDGKSISPPAAVVRARRAAAAASSSSLSPQRRYRDRRSPSTNPSTTTSPKRWLLPSNASPNRSSLSPRWRANVSSATASATTSPGASSAESSPASSPRSRSRRARVRHEIRALHNFVHAQGSGRISADVVSTAASKSGSGTSSDLSRGSSSAAAASDTSRVQSI